MLFIPPMRIQYPLNCIDFFKYFYCHNEINKKRETRISDMKRINVPKLTIAVKCKGLFLILNPHMTAKFSTEV